MRIPRRFEYPLQAQAVHIDYLRLRCGKERDFLENTGFLQHKFEDAIPFIAFAEWDVVLFVPCGRLYPKNLVTLYENRKIATTIAGSAGFYNYVWNHDINSDWQGRLLRLAQKSSEKSDVALLISLRFTDRFRSTYGIAAEVLFCQFLEGVRNKFKEDELDLMAVHSVGWNDVTVMMWTGQGGESALLAALTKIRYCTESDLGIKPSSVSPTVVAATYSHFVGNLPRYVENEFRFGALAKDVKHAQLLVRVTPGMEPSIRQAYGALMDELRDESIPVPDNAQDLISELGHYNFSADIKWAFESSGGEAAVKVIQRLRVKIGEQLKVIDRTDSSFSETTTEISFIETEVPKSVDAKNPIPLIEKYSELITQLMDRIPGMLEGRASNMARHRLAILLGSISTYLADPVRGSVVGHLCRFLTTTFETVLKQMERDEQEDLCHVLEYALNQATDGLSQFQHDANSLGLSGRGGYVRVIQAMEQWVVELLQGINVDLVPLITYGLQTAGTSAVMHRIDVPFSTAFTPARWPALFREIGQLAWYDLFGWRLESLEVWNQFTRRLIPAGDDDDRLPYVHAVKDVEEIFPAYLMLNVAAAGDLKVLDQIMLYHELSTVPRRLISRSLRRRIVLHVLLALHKARRPRTPDSTLDALPKPEGVGVATDSDLAAQLDGVASLWWNAWSEVKQLPGLREEINNLTLSAVNAFRDALQRVQLSEDRAMYGRTTELIPTSKSFKRDVADGVLACIELLDVLAYDHQIRRQRTLIDASYAGFGEVLARVDRIQRDAEKAYSDWKPYFSQAMKKGYVFSTIPPATILARLLTDLQTQKIEMLPSLSVILALWHRGVTMMMLPDEKELRDLRAFVEKKVTVEMDPL